MVLGAAVDHDPGFALSHFALGAALAVSGDFNSSLKHYDLCIKIHTEFDMAKKFRNGVFCHMDMFKKMEIAQGYVYKFYSCSILYFVAWKSLLFLIPFDHVDNISLYR